MTDSAEEEVSSVLSPTSAVRPTAQRSRPLSQHSHTNEDMDQQLGNMMMVDLGGVSGQADNGNSPPGDASVGGVGPLEGGRPIHTRRPNKKDQGRMNRVGLTCFQ